MKIRTETKEILFGIFLFCVAIGISLSMLFVMSGCTTTQTTNQIKKLKEAVEEKLENGETNTGSGQTSAVGSASETEPHEISPVGESGEEKTEEPNKAEDAFPLSDLTINVSVDSPQLIRHYTNGWATEHPWTLIKDLPVTVNIDSFNQGGLSLSGSTVKEGKYENGKWERTSCFWAFDENGVELGYDDHAYVKYEQPARFYGRAKYILVVSCSDYGDTFNLTGRSRVIEVK